ncbi:hypothetical protein E2C01_020810 [Portunus trituberculatus]|uniref:Uncharacterized protein n=1 Tax=Portunus trituberculatus TaxID=210409 RepID=A0A5B7E2K2_PORTR|nr:hypothetical protein [Portunus trituberculatus]
MSSMARELHNASPSLFTTTKAAKPAYQYAPTKPACNAPTLYRHRTYPTIRPSPCLNKPCSPGQWAADSGQQVTAPSPPSPHKYSGHELDYPRANLLACPDQLLPPFCAAEIAVACVGNSSREAPLPLSLLIQ